MSILSGKKVLLGISGGIAAYKTPNLVRCLIKKGAEVKVVMTDSAKDFVTPLSLSIVSLAILISVVLVSTTLLIVVPTTFVFKIPSVSILTSTIIIILLITYFLL